jgi:DNA polymerase III epsilon subunit-like protein
MMAAPLGMSLPLQTNGTTGEMINCIFDTETTGLVKHPDSKLEVQPRIIEWAGALCDGEGNIIDEKVWLINPECEISEEITRITGITNEMVSGQPTFAEVSGAILDYMQQAQQIIAHNLPFDKSMMELDLLRCNKTLPQFDFELCTVEENEPLYGYRPKLTQLYEACMGKPLEQTHRALDDVRALVEVCKTVGVLK